VKSLKKKKKISKKTKKVNKKAKASKKKKPLKKNTKKPTKKTAKKLPKKKKPPVKAKKSKKKKTVAKKQKKATKKAKAKPKKNTKKTIKKIKAKVKVKPTSKAPSKTPSKTKAKAATKTKPVTKKQHPKKKAKPKRAVKKHRKLEMKNAPNLPTAPVLKVILCGPHSIYWIPSDSAIHQIFMDSGIHPKEIEISQSIQVPKRRNEFLRARWLARRVLKYRDPLLKKNSGEPAWPNEVIGSISHKDGEVTFCSVPTETHYGLGIDLEKISKVSQGIESKICNAEESLIIDRVEALAKMKRSEVVALIFSFKESIFKTHFPMGQTHFGFEDATITEIAYDRREITARMNVKTSSRTPVGHEVLGFYNWFTHNDEKFVVSVAEERKPLVIEPTKAELRELAAKKEAASQPEV